LPREQLELVLKRSQPRRPLETQFLHDGLARLQYAARQEDPQDNSKLACTAMAGQRAQIPPVKDGLLATAKGGAKRP
jgi:hypothetical protein